MRLAHISITLVQLLFRHIFYDAFFKCQANSWIVFVLHCLKSCIDFSHACVASSTSALWENKEKQLPTWFINDSLDEPTFYRRLELQWTRVHSFGTLVKFVAIFIFTFFFFLGNEITGRSVLYLQCDFKNHFHIHYQCRHSELWKVNNELTFTLTSLSEESIQLNTCTWEKQVGSLPNTFWQS